MLSEEDKTRIEEEERYRAEVRAQLARPPRPPRTFDVVPFAIVALIAVTVGLAWLGISKSGGSHAPLKRDGELVAFRGVVASVGQGAASDSPRIDVKANGLTVHCYYVSGSPPVVGQYVIVKGAATGWDDSGGGLRPCVIASRE